ncbi:MAG: carboxypeptidase-like regulatory domain-containing protein [Rhodothermales bacterium]
MRFSRTVLIIAFAWLGAHIAAGQPSEHATLTGTVVDIETGLPLPNAHVFIAASMMGTATNDDGQFHLKHVPLGTHRLYVSMIGFEPVAKDTLLRNAGEYTFSFELVPAILELDGVTISAKRDARWKRRLRRFEQFFLGESSNADHAKILNPEVLNFEGGWGKLVATASAPLIIENRALGYRIQYFLKEFIRSGSTIKYDGEPFYEELEPENSKEAERWAENRRRAYYGSFRHYLLALLGGRLKEEGFLTFRRFSLDRLYSTRNRFGIDPTRLLAEGPTANEKLLRFSGYLEVLYINELETEAFLSWMGRSPWGHQNNQRSWVKLTDGPTLIDHTGEVVDPYGVTVYGYFAFERIADEVPKEYRPEQ